MPQGLLRLLNDKFGPSHDMAIRMLAKKIREEKSITKGNGPDERSFKPRGEAPLFEIHAPIQSISGFSGMITIAGLIS